MDTTSLSPPAGDGPADADPGMAAAHRGAEGDAVATVGPKRGRLAEILRNPEEREKLRFEVEKTTRSLNTISAEWKLAHGLLGRYLPELGWPRHPGAPPRSVRKADGQPPANRRPLAASMDDAEAVKSRLIRAVDRQIAKIDARVRKKAATVDEKDARTLGTLAKTLQTLIALDGDAGAKLQQQPEPLDRDRLRAALARRFALWAEEGSGPE